MTLCTILRVNICQTDQSYNREGKFFPTLEIIFPKCMLLSGGMLVPSTSHSYLSFSHSISLLSRVAIGWEPTHFHLSFIVPFWGMSLMVILGICGMAIPSWEPSNGSRLQHTDRQTAHSTDLLLSFLTYALYCSYFN